MQLCFFIIACIISLASWGQNPNVQAPPFEPSAKIQGILIAADSTERDSEKELVILKGNVQIVYNNQHIKAQQAIINLRNKRISLEGNVTAVSAKNYVGGTRMDLDYENNTGLIYDGYVQSGSVIFEGALLQKTSEDEYFAIDAGYTTCTTCPAAWSFSGSSIRAELGGYAYIKNSVLRVGGLPVLWLPYLIVPLKSDRQSGLLTPEVETSRRGGFTGGLSYFWAISRSTDATFTLKNYAKRGLKYLGEYRYVVNDKSYGELSAAGLRDSVFSSEDRFTKFRSQTNSSQSFNRWFLKYDHHLELPDGTVHRIKLNNASDLQYPRDFPTETLNHGDSAMENRISWTKNSDISHASVDGSYYINLLRADPLAGNDDSVHRLPEIRYSQVPQYIGQSDYLYYFDLNYVNFTRGGKAYDDLSNPQTINGVRVRYIENTCNQAQYENDPICNLLEDGKYDINKDIIRTGSRFDIRPTIYKPFQPADGIDITPRISYRETHYNFFVGEDRSNVRRYFRTELSSRLTLGRVFGKLEDPQSTRYKHEIQPELTWTSIPWIDHKSHPFFGFSQQNEAPISTRDSISDGDLGSDFGLQFDYNDRIYDRNLVTFAVTNRIVKKEWVEGAPIYKQIAALKVAQSYDANVASSSDPNKQPFSDLQTTLDVRLNRFQTYSIFNYFPYQNVTNASSRLRFFDETGRFLQLSATRQFKISPGQNVIFSERTEDYTFAAGLVSKYINLMGKFVYDANFSNAVDQTRIKSWAYIAQLKPPGECWLITFIHDQVTGGDTNFKINFEFTFDGVPKVPLPPETLDRFGF